MAIIVVEPPDEPQVRAAVKVLRDAGIRARKLSRPLTKGFVNGRYEETEKALSVLTASNIRASLRPG
jgi:hypothetical protein